MDIQLLKLECLKLASLDERVKNHKKTVIEVATEYAIFVTKPDTNITINIKEIVGNSVAEVLGQVIKDAQTTT